MEGSPELTEADHVKIGFNTGILDILSLLFTTQALVTCIEPREYAKLLRNQMMQVDKQGGHHAYVAGRKMAQQALHDQLSNMTLADLRAAMPLPKFQVIRGGKDEGGEDSVPSTGGDDSGHAGDHKDYEDTR